MIVQVKRILYVSAAVVALATGMGLDPLISALSFAAINFAFAFLVKH